MVLCRRLRHAVAGQAGGQGLRQAAGSPAIISEKNAPMDSAAPEFWNVERMPCKRRAALAGRDAAHDG